MVGVGVAEWGIKTHILSKTFTLSLLAENSLNSLYFSFKFTTKKTKWCNCQELH